MKFNLTKYLSQLSLLALLLLSGCTILIRPTLETELSTPLSNTATPEIELPCAPGYWEIAITSVDQTELADGTKLVLARIGIENNDSLWGSVSGPEISDANGTQKTVFLTTEDGSVYESLHGLQPISSEQLPGPNQTKYKVIGGTETPLMPPGFVTLGKTIGGTASYYNYTFQIPNSQIPDSITIGGMEVNCVFPHQVGENGRPIYHRIIIQLPAKKYNLDTDITMVREAPSARRYPNLVGAELVSPDWKESIFITDVTRKGNTIDVTFDFTNFSSHAVIPSFNGYLMGSNRLFICQDDYEQRSTHAPVQPGQTAQDLTWTFTVPENEANLTFVYVYGGNVDLNEVYRINLE